MTDGTAAPAPHTPRPSSTERLIDLGWNVLGNLVAAAILYLAAIASGLVRGHGAGIGLAIGLLVVATIVVVSLRALDGQSIYATLLMALSRLLWSYMRLVLSLLGFVGVVAVLFVVFIILNGR